MEKKKDTGQSRFQKLAENQTNYYVEAQTVNVALTEGTQVILNSGVKPGDQIVVDGQEKLKNGSKVFPRTARGEDKCEWGNGRGARAGGQDGGSSSHREFQRL